MHHAALKMILFYHLHHPLFGLFWRWLKLSYSFLSESWLWRFVRFWFYGFYDGSLRKHSVKRWEFKRWKSWRTLMTDSSFLPIDRDWLMRHSRLCGSFSVSSPDRRSSPDPSVLQAETTSGGRGGCLDKNPRGNSADWIIIAEAERSFC